MEFDFVVFGATGLQGRIVSRDLLEKGYSVLMCGRNKSRVEDLLKRFKNTDFEYVDLNDVKNATEVIKKFKSNVVVNCAEGDMNLNALRACIKAGVHSLDLGSDIPLTKKQLSYDKVMKKKGLMHITGCGSVPGIGNVMLRHAAEKFDTIETIEVGFAWDSNMKTFVVPFSMPSIFEEFTGPAPQLIDKKMIKVDPLNTLIKTHYREIGQQKTFNIGHHPETYTFYRYYAKKGVKNIKFYAGFPNHSFEKIMTMIELGFASKDEIEINGVKIAPMDYSSEVLKRIKAPEGYKEKENLWVDIYGTKEKDKKTIKMTCIVPSLRDWEDAGCNIDTGLPASIIAQMIKTGVINEPGSHSPEGVVPTGPFFTELRKRKMRVYENGKVIN